MHFPNKLNGHRTQAAIRCELTDSDIASALGIEIRSSSPVLALCRALVEAGHDPGTPMTCWRGNVLCLRIRSIGEAAGLEINGHGNGFKPWHDGGRAPLVAPLGNSDPKAGKARAKYLAVMERTA